VEKLGSLRPAAICAALLSALDASEARGRRRKRDQTPDRIGFGLKRDLLERAVREDPDPDAFEGWLLERCLDPGPDASVGGVRAMALEVLTEWRLACSVPAFGTWLAGGAPSDDTQSPSAWSVHPGAGHPKGGAP
jgi:hypothetical protein